VLLAREHEARANAPTARDVGDRLRRHTRVGRLSEQPVVAGIEHGDAERRARDLDAKVGRHQPYGIAIDDVERRRCPFAIGEVRQRGVLADLPELDPHDPRREDGHGDLGVPRRKPQRRRIEPLEARH